MIKIFLADGQAKFLDKLQSYLEPESDFEVIGTALNENEVLSFLELNSNVDVIVLDAELPDNDGLQICRVIKNDAKFKHIKILMLVAQYKNDASSDWRWKYADCCREKSISNEEFVRAIHNAHSAKLITRREKEIMVLFAQGYSSREIAKLIFISKHTVEIHQKRLYQKLGFVFSNSAIARYAVEHGFVKSSPLLKD